MTKTEIFRMKSDGKFLVNGSITLLLREDVRLALNALEKIVNVVVDVRKKMKESFTIREAFVVGSVLKGSPKSDVDLYFRMEGIDVATANLLKTAMFYALCEGKEKPDWIDTYFGTDLPGTGSFENQPSYRITRQVENDLRNYNRSMGAL